MEPSQSIRLMLAIAQEFSKVVGKIVRARRFYAWLGGFGSPIRGSGRRASTEFVVARDHVTAANPLTEAKTAAEGTSYFDGRILMLVLKSSAASGAN